ncbi:MAG: hypothetical protein ACD_37C00129G0002 [uncultured bacterium]|nr:MAG: hypothetical protein ACD_37C00129G0002 [uncultured bacterium]
MIAKRYLTMVLFTVFAFAISTPTLAFMNWSEDFLDNQTIRKMNSHDDDIDKFTEAGYPGPSRSKLYEHVGFPKTTVTHPYNPTGEYGNEPNVTYKLRNGHHPIHYTFNLRA